MTYKSIAFQRWGGRIRVWVGNSSLTLLLAVSSVSARSEPPAAPDGALQAVVEAGRRIYQDGVLPSGAPLQALRAGGVTLSGALAACANCHRRSGFGQVEGKSQVPTLAGDVLFAPGRYHDRQPPRGKAAPGMTVTAPRFDARPAYDTESLARALSQGMDPTGRPFDDLMPRYQLDAAAFDALAAYLRQLSVKPAPGVSAEALHLATIIAPGVSAAARRAVVDVLQAWAGQYRTGRRWVLHVWDLEGPEQGWDEQLARHYAEQPVFAVLSGLGGTEWLPVHRFCERMELPCVLPNLESAPVVERDFYSLYFSPGLSLEAAALAAHLRNPEGEVHAKRVIQVQADAAGERAAQVLQTALGGALPVETRHLDAAAPAAALDGLTADDALVLWLRPPRINLLSSSALPERPPAIYLSATLAPPEDLQLADAWRRAAAFVTVFDDPARSHGQAGMAMLPWLRQMGLELRDFRLQADTYGAAFFFTNAVARMRSRMNREYLMEMLERAVETKPAAASYPILSLGPNQRHAVKSAGILRYRAPEYRELQPVGRRIVP